MLLKISKDEKVFVYLHQHIIKVLTNIIKNQSVNDEELMVVNESLDNINDINISFDTETELLIAIFNKDRTDYKINLQYLNNIYES